MYIPTRYLIVVMFLSLLLTACNKEMEEHYERPNWLEDPIYQQLEKKGNFTNFLICIDRAGYKKSLSGAGYFTVFAPNDAAFDAFFTDQGLSGIDAIDTVMAQKIVTYALVYNLYEKARLADYQSSIGWQPLNAFKRRTAYYEGVHDETTLAGQSLHVTASNRNGGYVFGDNNNKHIPYFMDTYLQAKNLTASDYNYFFPGVTFSGFNVVDATVIEADAYAENGIIHEIDKVILPLPSIETQLATNPDYSVFKGLMDKYAVSFLTHPEVTERYRVLTGSNDPVYVKFYSALGFSPNNENFLKQSDNDAQSDGWTLFAPTNDVANQYINEVLLEKYKVMENLPGSIIYDFINAHMWQTTVWPSKFHNTLNFLGEEARFNATGDVVEKKVLSNGMFYGTSKVQDSDVFRSVYGKAYLDPDYTLMTRFFNRELKSTIISPNVKFTLFLVRDSVFRANGHDFNVVRNEWVYNSTATLGAENWSRMMNMHVVVTLNEELNNLSGKGIIQTNGGEFIKWDNNKVYAAGNLEMGPLGKDTLMAKVNQPGRLSKMAHNGIVHYANDILRFPDNVPVRGPGHYIRDLGDQVNEPYQRFYDYLKNSLIYSDVSPGFLGAINGVSAGVFHTYFIPSNTAIAQAVTDGMLPGVVAPTTEADRQKVVDFISYHILPKFSIINDLKEEGSFETLYKPLIGDVPVITISNKPGEFTVTDAHGRVATVINGPGTNVLGNQAVYHVIDKYLKY